MAGVKIKKDGLDWSWAYERFFVTIGFTMDCMIYDRLMVVSVSQLVKFAVDVR